MAALGYKNFDDMVGQTQRLLVAEEHLHYKSQGLDLRPLLRPAATINPNASAIIHTELQDHEIDASVDREFIAGAMAALEHKTPVVLHQVIERHEGMEGGVECLEQRESCRRGF